jgi:hypothetical protein
LHTLLNRPAGTSDAPDDGEDVLLSEARLVSEPPERRQAPSRPQPTGGFDPRSAIFRARETYRDRARAKIAAARQSSGVAAQHEQPPTATPRGDGEPLATSIDARRQDDESTPSGGLTEALPSTFPALEDDSPDENLLAAANTTWDELDSDWQSIAPDDAMICAVEPETEQIPASEPANPAPRVPDDLPAWFRADLPRICRTCRDYRPAAEGQRGWCANAWAFTHSRLVQADEAAPCLSAIGDWWAPVDDVWLVAADVSAHGRATPLLDQLIAQEQQRRRRS